MWSEKRMRRAPTALPSSSSDWVPVVSPALDGAFSWAGAMPCSSLCPLQQLAWCLTHDWDTKCFRSKQQPHGEQRRLEVTESGRRMNNNTLWHLEKTSQMTAHPWVHWIPFSSEAQGTWPWARWWGKSGGKNTLGSHARQQIPLLCAGSYEEKDQGVVTQSLGWEKPEGTIPVQGPAAEKGLNWEASQRGQDMVSMVNLDSHGGLRKEVAFYSKCNEEPRNGFRQSWQDQMYILKRLPLSRPTPFLPLLCCIVREI